MHFSAMFFQGPESYIIIIIGEKHKQKPQDKQEYRICLDLQHLNKITLPDMHHVPVLMEELHKFEGCAYISKLDIRHGFHNLSIDPASRKYCGFTWNHKYYQLCLMGFGFMNASQCFQRSIRERIVLDKDQIPDLHHEWMVGIDERGSRDLCPFLVRS